MNALAKRELTDLAIERRLAEQGGMVGNRVVTACAVSSVDGKNSETILERMERYTKHLEGLILRKNEEVCSLQKILALHAEEERQKIRASEYVIIHQARQAAMEELLGVAARHWHQSLNAITLVVRNMKKAWEAGEFDGDFLDHSLSEAMEQVALLSRFIDDIRALSKSAGYDADGSASDTP